VPGGVILTNTSARSVDQIATVSRNCSGSRRAGRQTVRRQHCTRKAVRSNGCRGRLRHIERLQQGETRAAATARRRRRWAPSCARRREPRLARSSTRCPAAQPTRPSGDWSRQYGSTPATVAGHGTAFGPRMADAGIDGHDQALPRPRPGRRQHRHHHRASTDSDDHPETTPTGPVRRGHQAACPSS